MHGYAGDAVVTADAMHTQRKIQYKNSWYAFTVKDNRPTAGDHDTPATWSSRTLRRIMTTGAEARTVQVAPLSVGELDFPGARSIALVTRHTKQKRKISTKRCVNLINPTAEQFGQIMRRHWAIESMFYVRDATMHEDRHTMHTGSGALNFALLRSLVIGVSSITKARSLPDATWRFRKVVYSFLAHFQVDPLALAA